jgi:hypothetical protein
MSGPFNTANPVIGGTVSGAYDGIGIFSRVNS